MKFRHLSTGRLHTDRRQLDQQTRLKKSVSASSVTESISLPKLIPNREFKLRKRETLINEAYFLEGLYNYTFDFAPGVSFFKFLSVIPKLQSKLPKLKVEVPETVVFHDRDSPYRIFSNENGEICREHAFDEYKIASKIIQEETTEKPVCVEKKQHYDKEKERVIGCIVQAMNRKEAKNSIRYIHKRDKEKTCYEKFIQSKGLKPCVCRTAVYTKNKFASWLITSLKTYSNGSTITNSKSAYIIRLNKGKFHTETSELTSRVQEYLEKNLQVVFTELVCDFIRDNNEVWWLINIKAFKIEGEFPVFSPFFESDQPFESILEKNRLVEYKNWKTCVFCKIGYQEMSHELTVKMINELTEHLEMRGKLPAWAKPKKIFHRAYNYQRVAICDECFSLFEVTSQLKKYENLIARALGVEIPTCNYSEVFNTPQKLLEYRLIFVLERLDELQIPDPHNLSIQYKFLGENVVVPLCNPIKMSLVLNNIKMVYFFSASYGEFEDFLKRTKWISVRLIKKNMEIGISRLSIQDFRSKHVIVKNYYQPFSCEPFCYLKASIGVESNGEQLNLKIPLKEIEGIFVSSDLYVTSDPLPEEWIEILPSMKNRSKSSELLNYRRRKWKDSELDTHENTISKLEIQVIYMKENSSFRSCSFDFKLFRKRIKVLNQPIKKNKNFLKVNSMIEAIFEGKERALEDYLTKAVFAMTVYTESARAKGTAVIKPEHSSYLYEKSIVLYGDESLAGEAVISVRVSSSVFKDISEKKKLLRPGLALISLQLKY